MSKSVKNVGSTLGPVDWGNVEAPERPDEATINIVTPTIGVLGERLPRKEERQTYRRQKEKDIERNVQAFQDARTGPTGPKTISSCPECFPTASRSF